MTTIKVGSKDAYGFHPNGDIVDPDAIDAFIGTKYAQKPIAPSDLPSYLGQTALNTTYASQTAVAANTTAITGKLDKTEAAATYVVFRNYDGTPVTGKHVEITLTADGTDIDTIKVVTP